MTEPTPEQLAAGQPKGLTPAMCSYLRGETPEELGNDADAFIAAWGTPPPAAPAVLVGGNRGTDVASGGGGVNGGAALYRERHGLDDEGKRSEPTSGRNPFTEISYRMETR